MSDVSIRPNDRFEDKDRRGGSRIVLVIDVDLIHNRALIENEITKRRTIISFHTIWSKFKRL